MITKELFVCVLHHTSDKLMVEITSHIRPLSWHAEQYIEAS